MKVETRPFIEAKDGGIIIHLTIQPQSARTEVVGFHGDPPRLKIRIAAPPVDRKANDAVLDFLKKTLRVSRNQLEIIKGETIKQKDIFCTGLGVETATKLLTVENK